MSGFFAMPNEIVKNGTFAELSLSAKAAYVVLGVHTDRQGICWPSIPTIAAEAGIDEKSARRAIKELRDTGLLAILPGRGRGNKNKYQLVTWNARPAENRASCPVLSGKKQGIMPGEQEPEQDKQEPTTHTSAIIARTSQEMRIEKPSKNLLLLLSQFFSQNDVHNIATWPEIKDYNLDYIREKADLTAQKDPDNPPGFLREALRRDFKPTIPAAERRAQARQETEEREKAEQRAGMREREKMEAEILKLRGIWKQLSESEKAEIEKLAKAILKQEGTIEDNPIYKRRLQAACESIVKERYAS